MKKHTLSREKKIYRVTILGAAINVFLVIFKFSAGVLSGSAAMTADAVHSLSDFMTDIVLVLFVRLGAKPKDSGHEYGHGKYETLATAAIGISLVAVGIGLLYNSVSKIISWGNGTSLEAPGLWALAAAISSIALKEAIYHITARTGRDVNSSAVIANAWHHRSDALSSVGTGVGVGGAILLGDKWTVLDPIAAAIVSIMILWTAIMLIRDAGSALIEHSLPKDIENRIKQIALSVDDVSDVHNLRTRSIGSYYAMEMHVRMPGDTSLTAAHDTMTEIEHRLKAEFGAETHVQIHCEPEKHHL